MKWRPGCCCRNFWRAPNIDSQLASDTDGNASTNTGTPAPQAVGGGRIRRLLRWIRTHKFLFILLLLLVFVVVEAATIPWFDISRLKSENPSMTALMRQRLDEAREAGKQLRILHHWVPLAMLPRELINAVIVEEDGTFYTHGGVDWFEVKESVGKNVQEGRAARGASTITQQLAKNLYLSTSKDPIRKAKELIITLLLERGLSKDRILELYLNSIEWGRGIFGVDAAAQAYFGKPASRLSLDEAVRLAAVIPSPLRHTPALDSRYLTRRKQMVLDRMAARNMINQPQQGETLSSADTTTLPEGTRPPGEGQSTDTTSRDTTAVDKDGHDGL